MPTRPLTGNDLHPGQVHRRYRPWKNDLRPGKTPGSSKTQSSHNGAEVAARKSALAHLRPCGRRCEAVRLGLVCRGGLMRFLKSLTGDNMSLRGAAHLVELVSHEASFGNRS